LYASFVDVFPGFDARTEKSIKAQYMSNSFTDKDKKTAWCNLKQLHQA